MVFSSVDHNAIYRRVAGRVFTGGQLRVSEQDNEWPWLTCVKL